MNLKKKSLIFICLAGLACVVGTGFAAWKIKYDSEASASNSGTLKADTVEVGSGLSISGGKWSKDGSDLDKVEVKFGADTSGVDASNVWYENTGSIGDTTGTYTYTFRVTVYGENTKTQVTTQPTLNVDDSHKSAWGEATTGEKPLINYEVSEINAPSGSGTGDYSFTVTFSWGSGFGGMNPYKYYNDGEKTAASNGSEATANLQKLEALNGATFTVSTTLSTAINN